MSFYYLASPYSHDNPSVRLSRAREAEDATLWFLQQRIWVYSPITHCCTLALHYGLKTDATSWNDYNRAMVEAASGLFILTLEGWRDSEGVALERSFAEEFSLDEWLVTRHKDGTYSYERQDDD